MTNEGRKKEFPHEVKVEFFGNLDDIETFLWTHEF